MECLASPRYPDNIGLAHRDRDVMGLSTLTDRVDFSDDEWYDLLRQFGNGCALCGSDISVLYSSLAAIHALANDYVLWVLSY